MKRTLLIIASFVLLAIAISSCKSSESCPAYGEARKFQVEQRY